ncbi:hypothetical protein L2D04_19935 (plasmid) [Pantoea agglomerans]|uniref:hypothetical protein n=1 Tax=Enterobacter agglomerans TaxID=549 RepID=UPI001F288D6D|nr:hypothetical protein [Pantoea agglomerans]UJQ25861.1 hypothetical protein L2D04_19935 [Pantoea agglomerans]
MSLKSRFSKIIPVSGKWYLLVKGEKSVNGSDAIYPIAAWGECESDGTIIGLSTINKSHPAQLMGPPPGFKCYYLSEEELTDSHRYLLSSTTNFLKS